MCMFFYGCLVLIYYFVNTYETAISMIFRVQCVFIISIMINIFFVLSHVVIKVIFDRKGVLLYYLKWVLLYYLVAQVKCNFEWVIYANWNYVHAIV